MKNYILIVVILVVIITGLITLNIFFQQSLQLETAEQYNRQQLMFSKSIAFNIQAYLQFVKEQLLHIANIIVIKNINSKDDMKLIADEIKRDNIFTTEFGLISPKGDVIFYNGNIELLNQIIDEIMTKLKKRNNSKPYVYSSNQHIYVFYPYYKDVYLNKVFFMSVSIEDISKYFMKGITSEEKGYAWMLNRSGTLLYHPTQPSMVGGNIYKPDKKCFQCHSNFDIVKRIIEGKTSNFGRYIAPTGINKIIAFSTIDIEDDAWAIAVSSPFSEVTATTKKSMELYSYFIISIFVVTSLVSGVLILFNRKVILAEEKAKYQQELEIYASELEKKVKERTAELYSEKEKLNTIVSAIGAGIIMLNKQGKIQWANQKINEMVGFEIVGMSCEDLCADCSVLLDSELKDINTAIMSNLFGHKGSYYHVTNAPIKGENGEIHGFIRLVQDITDIKKMEEQMINSEKLASIGRLAAGIAHEIGNPLTSIFSFVQILREMEDDDFKKESLDTIYFHIKRISDILKQLSGFTRMPAEELKKCKINEIIETSIQLIQYDKKAKDISIKKELSDLLPDAIVDSNQLSQVFVNIILNAFDAMPEGGDLIVKSTFKDNNIIIEFKDSGIGIPKENLSNIFDPFYTTKEKGTGLGLAVSYDIIKKMNGTINVDSELGKGTTFTIKLPVNNSKKEHHEI